MPPNDEPLRGSGAIPYRPLGGGGEFSPKFEGFKPDTMACARPATDEELKLLDQPEGLADFMAELAKLKSAPGKPAPALTLEPAQLPLCAACGAPATRAFGRPSQPTSLKRFCQNHWLRDLKKDGNTEVHRGQMSGKAALAGREGNGGTADAGDGGGRVLDVLVPVQQGKGRKGKSAVSWDAGPDQAQLQKARSGDAGADRQLGFTILPHFFEEASLSAATAQYNALYDKVVQIGKLIERRRTGESASRCSFCKTEFGKGNHEYGVWTYEDPPGSGLKHQIRTCRSDQCVREYEKAMNDIALRVRGIGR